MPSKEFNTVKLTPESQALLVQFRDGENFEARLRALDQLITAKQIPHIARRDEFEPAILKLTEVASDVSDPSWRLLAVSRMGLLAATVTLKPVREKIRELLQQALAEPLPPMQSLVAATDRLYVAQACALAAQPWCPRYLSDSAIVEETGENARSECLRTLADQVRDLHEVLRFLRSSIDNLIPETESPANSTGRRLRRIISALRPALSRCRVSPGSQPGRILTEILREPFKKFGRPDELKILEDLAAETFALIHELMRVGFSLATESSTYSALRVCREWFPEHRWQSITTKSETLHLVVQDLTEAIIMLAKQNVTDQDLMDILHVACGTREKARTLTAEISRNLPGLSSEVRRYLGAEIDLEDGAQLDREPGEITSTSELVHLADLLVEAETLYREAEAELKESSFASENTKLLRLLGKTLSLADSARSLARRHFIQLRGRVGDIVEFSQVEHEMVGGFQPGIRRVRIQRPPVVQMHGSAPHVIRKGLVEPV